MTGGDEECSKIVTDDRNEGPEIGVRIECGGMVQKQRSSELEVWTQCFVGVVVFSQPGKVFKSHVPEKAATISPSRQGRPERCAEI
jgi:hypothetical protein